MLVGRIGGKSTQNKYSGGGAQEQPSFGENCTYPFDFGPGALLPPRSFRREGDGFDCAALPGDRATRKLK